MLANIIYSTVSALLFEIYKEEEFDFGPALLFDCNSVELLIVIPCTLHIRANVLQKYKAKYAAILNTTTVHELKVLPAKLSKTCFIFRRLFQVLLGCISS